MYRRITLSTVATGWFPRDRSAERRPCGLLCKRGAVGMLIGDVLGLPLIPWVLAEPIGKAAYKLRELKELQPHDWNYRAKFRTSLSCL